MRRLRITTCLTAALLVLAACGGGDDDDGAAVDVDVADGADEAGGVQDEVATDDAPVPNDGGDDAGAATSGGGDTGTATLELANGESFEFSILCMLDSQVAAGSEILFTVVSDDDPGLDITQFGDEGTITGSGNISVYDASYETLWDAGTLYDAFGGSFDLSLSGSTVNGSGSFYPAGDIQAEPVDGTVTANC